MGVRMRETERSLRAYFLFVGIVSVLFALSELSKAIKLGSIPLTWLLAIYVPVTSNLVIGAAFIVAGIKLKRELPKGARWIQTMLVASGVMLFVNGALVVSVLKSNAGEGSIVGAAFGLAITIYLHRNVVRLAAEAAVRDGMPPPPVAKIV